MMPAELITIEDAQALLAPYHDHMFNAVNIAWLEWRQYVLPRTPLFKARSQAGFIQDVLERELRSRLGANPQIKMSPLGGEDRFWMWFASGVVVRTKKFNQRFGVSNYRTRRAKAFNGQRRLNGVPSGPRLTLGYQLTPGNDSALGTHIALLKDECHLMWKYQLIGTPDGGATIAPETLPLPFGVPELKLKRDAAKKAAD